MAVVVMMMMGMYVVIPRQGLCADYEYLLQQDRGVRDGLTECRLKR